ncbi:MAG TPA: AAA family ATPase [Candidatus Saccharimonadales bacterium]|nr:AAA family ATPase [Candidatus Saccharimonadales bacterium]
MTTSSKVPEIIGIAGTNGSGKDTLGHMLADRHKYLFVSVTDLLRAECVRRGLPPIRENTRMVSAEWRRELGLGVLIDKAIAEYELVRDEYEGVAISSLRNPGEVDRVHDFGGIVVWIDADARVRYDRIQRNVEQRDRKDDKRTFKQFVAEEEAEMHKPVGGDAASLDGTAVKAKCDLFIDNTHENVAVFDADAEKQLGLA